MDAADFSDDHSLYITLATCMVLVLSTLLFYRHWISSTGDAVSPYSSEQSRKLSPFESYYYDLNTQGMEIISYMAFVDSYLPLSLELVTSAARVLQRRHPLLKMRVIEDSDSDGASQYFVPMEVVAVDVEEVKSESWEDVHAEEMKTHLNLSQGPLWRVRLLRDGDQQDGAIHKNIMAVSFAHCMADGNCIMRFLDDLMDVFCQLSGDDVINEVSWPLLPPVEDYFPRSKVRPWEKVVIKCHSAIGGLLKRYWSWKGVVQSIPCFPADVPKSPDIVKETRALSFHLTMEEVHKLRQNCRKHGATVNGAVTAAASVAACKIMQGGKLSREQKIHTIFMVNMRHHCEPSLEPDKSFGFYSSKIKLDVTVRKDGDSRDGFWKLATECTNQKKEKLRDNGKEAVKAFKSMSVIRKVFRLTALDVVSSAKSEKCNDNRSEYAFAVSNLGDCAYFTKDKTRIFELVRKVSATSGFNYQPIFCHFVATFHGKMFWNLAYHTNVCTKSQAQEYADATLEILQMVID
ncbi:uncharacterized protein [Ptychodera flava]|uniref:uncharacterized protein n=1 Tax=Ptychodera flava TaxID=63121 RepID=UPI00396A1F68